MTEKKKHFVSLSVKSLFVLLLGLVLGVCVCLLANFTGEQIIERSYMSDKAVLKRTNRAAQEFQSFVRQNSISTRDTDMLARWGESRKNYYIMLYHDQRQILEIGWGGARGGGGAPGSSCGGRRVFAQGADGQRRLSRRVSQRHVLRRDL